MKKISEDKDVLQVESVVYVRNESNVGVKLLKTVDIERVLNNLMLKMTGSIL